MAEQIQRFASLPVAFNHALVERYTNLYRTMGAHSDQALDLRGDSFIAIFSCYAHPERAHARKLVVGEKAADGGAFELPLLHHGVVIFSVGANRRFRHKIEVTDAAADNEWLGFTFRTSKTFVRHRGDAVLFDDDVRLTLADDEQRQEFLQLRRRENVETDFTYPRITYTLSESDLRPPSGPGHEASG